MLFDPNFSVSEKVLLVEFRSVCPLSDSSVALLLSKFKRSLVAVLSPISIPWVPYTTLGKVKSLESCIIPLIATKILSADTTLEVLGKAKDTVLEFIKKVLLSFITGVVLL